MRRKSNKLPRKISVNTKKASKGTKDIKKKKRKKKKKETFARYILEVLRQVHLDLGISSKAMTIMDNFVYDVMDRIAKEAARLVSKTNRKTQFL